MFVRVARGRGDDSFVLFGYHVFFEVDVVVVLESFKNFNPFFKYVYNRREV